VERGKNDEAHGPYDAVPVQVMGPAGAVKLLRARFPNLACVFADPDHPDFDDSDAYLAYAEFAREVLKRPNDPTFFASAGPS
jgi:hypothetical protein